VVWVAQSGGQFTSVSAALASITDNGPAHRYVIKVAPGTYTEAASVVMKNDVDIEGSGQDTTTIACACGSNTTPRTDGSSATVRGTSLNFHMRDLSIANTGGGTYTTGVWISSPTSLTDPHFVLPLLTNVTIHTSGATGNYGLWASDATFSVDTVHVRVDQGTTEEIGLVVIGSAEVVALRLNVYVNGFATTKAAVWNEDVTSLYDSFVEATGGLHNVTGTIQVYNSGVTNPSGNLSIRCVGSYDAFNIAVSLDAHCM
jgi:hypothetical protein